MVINKDTCCDDELKELTSWDIDRHEVTPLAMPGQNSNDKVTGEYKRRSSLKRQMIII